MTTKTTGSAAPSATGIWTVGARSETGYVRSANEDRMGWRRTPFGDIYVIADGMGGYKGGALAAEIVAQTLQEFLGQISPEDPNIGEQMRAAFDAANRAVYGQRRQGDAETSEMGATGVAVLTCGNRWLVGHVGDSRAYLWRPTTGLIRLTRDHSRVQHLVDSGLLEPELANDHPEASMLERALGHQATVEADVSPWQEAQPGDTVLLCTDGLCGFVGDEAITDLLRVGGEPQAVADRLVEAALGTGGADNVTVQLARYTERPGRSLVPRFWSRLRPGLLLWAGVAVLALAALFAMIAQYRHNQRDLASAHQQLSEMQSRIAALQAAQAAPPAPTSSASKPPSAPGATLGPGSALVPAPLPTPLPAPKSLEPSAPTSPAPAPSAPASESPTPRIALAPEAAASNRHLSCLSMTRNGVLTNCKPQAHSSAITPKDIGPIKPKEGKAKENKPKDKKPPKPAAAAPEHVGATPQGPAASAPNGPQAPPEAGPDNQAH